MKRSHLGLILIASIFAFAGCTDLRSGPQPEGDPPPTGVGPWRGDEDLKTPAIDYLKGNRWSYEGYEILKLEKTVRPQEATYSTRVTYGVVKKGGRKLAEFDGVYFGPGNATDFALLPLLGKETKQLLVSQTIARGGRQWIVDFSPEFRIIFDSNDFRVGRETDDTSVLDLDGDGIYEIRLPVFAFYGAFYGLTIPSLSMAESPRPAIIFKYDATEGKYLPANHIFQDYFLNRIQQRAGKLNPMKYDYLDRKLDLLLHYVYAGKEEEGWAFFDENYEGAGKKEVKTKVRAVLEDEPVYKYIREHRAR